MNTIYNYNHSIVVNKKYFIKIVRDFLEYRSNILIWQYDFYSIYFLSNIDDDNNIYETYVIANNLSQELIKDKIIEPELSDDEFKIQFALGTISRRVHKLDKEKLLTCKYIVYLCFKDDPNPKNQHRIEVEAICEAEALQKALTKVNMTCDDITPNYFIYEIEENGV